MPILNSSYHAVKYAELRIGSILKVCRFVIRHITQTETQTETEANFTHGSIVLTYWGPNPWIMVNYPLFIIKLDYLKDILNIVYFVNDEVPTVKIHRVCGIITMENIS